MCGLNLYGMGEEATIGWLRHSEIKHGRIAMFAFVGYMSGANGIHFPWNIQGDMSFATIAAAGGPADQWDALPTAAKLQVLSFSHSHPCSPICHTPILPISHPCFFSTLVFFFLQILGTIGLLEYLSESSYALEAAGEKHYTKGGKPGFFPPLKTAGVPHPVPFNLFDPFGFSKNASPEKKEKGLQAEINNGRLAMIGIFGFVAESKISGAVPALPFIKPYAGEIMAPFSSTNIDLPLVSDMLKYPWTS